jgi:hypothetical protein
MCHKETPEVVKGGLAWISTHSALFYSSICCNKLEGAVEQMSGVELGGELQAVEIFRPGRVTVSLSADQDTPGCTWTKALLTPSGYAMVGTTFQHFACGGCLYHYCFQQPMASGKGSGMDTPSTVLDALFSSVSLAGKGPPLPTFNPSQ